MLWVLRPRITTVELCAPTFPLYLPARNKGRQQHHLQHLLVSAMTSDVKKLTTTNTASHTTRRRATVNSVLLK